MLTFSCSGQEGPPRRTETEEPFTDEAAISLVSDYVQLLNEGDFVAANELRCGDAQLGADDLGSFGSRVAEIKDDLGGELRVVSSKTVIEPARGVSLQLKGAGAPVVVLISNDEGVPRVCGQRVGTSSAVLRQLNLQPQDEVESGASPREVAGTSPLPGYQGGGLGVPPLGPLENDSSVEEAWFQEWTGGAHDPAVGITAMRLSDSEATIGAQLAVESLVVDNALEAFQLDSPAARAVRHLGSSITFVQPPGAGPLRDLATLRYGNLLVVVTVAPVESGAPSSLPQIAAQVDEVADSKPVEESTVH
jgi:hypothetical protein